MKLIHDSTSTVPDTFPFPWVQQDLEEIIQRNNDGRQRMLNMKWIKVATNNGSSSH